MHDRLGREFGRTPEVEDRVIPGGLPEVVGSEGSCAESLEGVEPADLGVPHPEHVVRAGAKGVQSERLHRGLADAIHERRAGSESLGEGSAPPRDRQPFPRQGIGLIDLDACQRVSFRLQVGLLGSIAVLLLDEDAAIDRGAGCTPGDLGTRPLVHEKRIQHLKGSLEVAARVQGVGSTEGLGGGGQDRGGEQESKKSETRHGE